MSASKDRPRAAAYAATESGEDHSGELIAVDHKARRQPAQRRALRATISGEEIPESALDWHKDKSQLARQLWRNAVFDIVSKQRGLNFAVAWALEWLMRNGFAWCGNERLAKEIASSADAVDKALRDLERSGLIIRVWHREKQRRFIFPSLPAGWQPREARGLTTRELNGQQDREARGNKPARIGVHKRDSKGAATAAPHYKIERKAPSDLATGEDVPEFMRDDFKPDRLLSESQTVPQNRYSTVDDDEPLPF